ncbi:hypothetical protein BGZ58_002806 [Dissophora ornata]|nr:hypothetical protein BGZ58_002806 [Dissophora ornata]
MPLSPRIKRKASDEITKDPPEDLSKPLTLPASAAPDRHPQNTQKRRRNAIQQKEKAEIVEFWKKNENMSLEKIAKVFDRPRTTIYGIIKDWRKSQENENNTYKRYVCRTPDLFRITEMRFWVLENLLMDWMGNLRSRSIPVTGQKIISQAPEILRMLSGLLVKPLPKCLFSSGWLKGFKKRRGFQLKIPPGQEITPQDLVDSNLLKSELSRRREDDIYTCEIVSMYLNTPASLHDQSQGEEPQWTDNSSATVLICCNASGTDKRGLLVLVRQDSREFSGGGHYRLAHDASAEDLTTEVLENWLTEFDKSLNRNISLLVDDTVWAPLRKILFKRPEKLSRIAVIKAAAYLNQFRSTAIPSAVPVAVIFKAYYHMHLDQRSFGASTSNPPTVSIDIPLEFMKQAWEDVKKDDICSYFSGLRTLIDTPPRKAKTRCSPPTCKGKLQHYISQDKDVGPTDFLRDRIKVMQHNQEFETAFGGVRFEKVVYGIQPCNLIKFGGSRANTSWNPTCPLELDATTPSPSLGLYL